MRKHYTKAQRAELVALVARGEATPRAAAGRLGVTESTAYYWLKRSGLHSAALVVGKPRLRPRPIGAPTFARLVPATEASRAISVRVGDVVIAVQRDFDAELLRAVVTALAERTP